MQSKRKKPKTNLSGAGLDANGALSASAWMARVSRPPQSRLNPALLGAESGDKGHAFGIDSLRGSIANKKSASD
jgi:hypothetical protein